MSLVVNGVNIENVVCNGVAINNVFCNGVEVWKRQTDIITNSALSSGISMSVIYEYCNYGEWSEGGTTISGTTISNACSDYYEAGRYYLSRVRFKGLSITGQGQKVSITNTYSNAQVSEGYDNSNNYAKLYAYNLSTKALVELGSIRNNGTKTFTLPNDGNTYTLCVELSTWAAVSYATNTTTLSISQLFVS